MARHIFAQILNAIYFLHSHGVCHRDLKPSNIMVTDENIVKICDFNISKFSENFKSFSFFAGKKIKMLTYTGINDVLY